VKQIEKQERIFDAAGEMQQSAQAHEIGDDLRVREGPSAPDPRLDRQVGARLLHCPQEEAEIQKGKRNGDSKRRFRRKAYVENRLREDDAHDDCNHGNPAQVDVLSQSAR
jgi:hypothetical protein